MASSSNGGGTSAAGGSNSGNSSTQGGSTSNASAPPSRQVGPSSSGTGAGGGSSASGSSVAASSSSTPPPSQLPRAGTSMGQHSSTSNAGGASPRAALASTGGTVTPTPSVRSSAPLRRNPAAQASTSSNSASLPSSASASAAPVPGTSAGSGPTNVNTAANQLSSQPTSSTAGQGHSIYIPNYNPSQQTQQSRASQQSSQGSSSRGHSNNNSYSGGVPANSSLFGYPQSSYSGQPRYMPSGASYQPAAAASTTTAATPTTAGNSSPRTAAAGNGNSHFIRNSGSGLAPWQGGASNANNISANALINGGYGTPLPWMSGLPPSSSSSTNQPNSAQGYGWFLADPAGWSGWPSARKACSGFEENQMVSFTWTISDARLLREEVEYSPLPSDGGRSVSAGAGKSEVWTTQPLFGDGKWKLELVRTSRAVDKPEDQQQHSGDTGKSDEAKGDEVEGDKKDDCAHTEGEKDNRSLTVLSIYLTSAQLDYAQADVEIPTAIMFGIRPARVPAGQTYSRDGPWLWRHFTNHVFKREEEYVECHQLPSISELLRDEAIAKQDAFALTVQIGTGPGTVPRTNGTFTPASAPIGVTTEAEDDSGQTTLPFVVKDRQLVPKSLLNGLEEMIDSAATGDVVLIIRERGVVVRETDDDGGERGARRIVPLPVGQPMPSSVTSSGQARSVEDERQHDDEDQPEIVVRDRVLWAHSSILCSRSEFFRDMLGSHFLEGQSQALNSGGEGAWGSQGGTTTATTTMWHEHFGRRFKTLRIPDADFTAAYWLLRYLYLEEVEFMEHEDVRSTLDEEWMIVQDDEENQGGAEAGTTSRKPHWEWRSLAEIKQDSARQDQTAQFGASRSQSGAHSGQYGVPRSLSSRHSLHSMSSSTGGGVETGTAVSQTTVMTPGSRRSASGLHHDLSPYHRRPGDWDPRSRGSASDPHYIPDTAEAETTPRMEDPGSTSDDSLGDTLRRDPHNHPAERASPASALGLYRLAHRYGQRGLCSLAKQHLVASLTPQSCFSILLATHLYADLHEPVKAYVLENWHLVCTTSEFERCCDEVSAGEWGSDAGRALRIFMRSLVSPLSASNLGSASASAASGHHSTSVSSASSSAQNYASGALAGNGAATGSSPSGASAYSLSLLQRLR